LVTGDDVQGRTFRRCIVRYDGMNLCGCFVVGDIFDFTDHICELSDVAWWCIFDFGFAADPRSVAEDG